MTPRSLDSAQKCCPASRCPVQANDSRAGPLLYFAIIANCLVLGCGPSGGDAPPNSLSREKSELPRPVEGARLNKETTKKLEGLGYFDRTKTQNPEDRSVTEEKEAAFEGLNLYGSRHVAKALLLDLEGKVLHTWSAETPKPPWMHVVLRPNGDLLAVAKANYLAKIDWNSKVLWKHLMMAHHDVTVAPNGHIYVLTHKVEKYAFEGARIPIMDDALEILSQDGKLQRKVRLFPILRQLVPESRLSLIRRRLEKGVAVKRLVREGAPSDTTHGNSIEILDRPIPDVAPAGSVLMSFREINRIVILDPGLGRLLWVWGKGELEGQHHATFLDNGNIMVFDNGVRRKKSRVLEVNPKTRQIEWSHTADNLYTRLRGSAQKLPNGNVLITESDKGHVIEVTPKGRVVWEFWNPDVIGDDPPTRGVIYRMTRYDLGYLDKRLLFKGDEKDRSLQKSGPETAPAEVGTNLE
jgi:hypothetical protein